MATTSRPITELAIGIRDTTGAVVASGKARFYEPGTLTPRSAFSDDVCTSAITPPLTLNAGGQGTAYTLEPTRMIVKDSTETTTYYDGIVNLNRHDAVYVTHSALNGGAETTLENVLTTASASFGSGFQYKVTSTGTVRNYVSVISERCVSVKDFGAVGDGATDDTTAIQSTVDYVANAGGGIVFLPIGTYQISSTILITSVGVSIAGAGRAMSFIRNTHTGASAISFDIALAGESRAFMRDFAVTHSTTSSATGILVTNGDRMSISNVQVGLHRTGIDCNAVTAARIADSNISSTDGNASVIGIRVGSRGKVTDCELTTTTDNGTGIVLNGADSHATNCWTNNFATGMSAAATNSGFIHCTATGATTGVSLSGTASYFDAGRVTSCTTGVSVGAVASVRVNGVTYASNTTDLSVNSSATNFQEIGNWAVLSAGTATNFTIPDRAAITQTSGVGTATFTPAHTCNSYQHYRATNAGTLTVAAPSGTNKMVGDVIGISVHSTSSSLSVTWNSTYKRPDGSTTLTAFSVGGSGSWSGLFVWDGSVYRLMFEASSIAGNSAWA